MTKETITDFDNLEISELLEQPTPELLVAIYLKVKQINGKVRWHDKFIWGLISTILFSVVVAIVVGIIN